MPSDKYGDMPNNMPSDKTLIGSVLVVDDESPARLRLQAMVEELDGYTVVATAANGEQALLASEAHTPDIVLMDIRMPGIDGLQAARALASLERPPAVIFCTAYDEHALSAFQASAIDYLLKPIKAEQLARALDKAKSVNRAQLAHMQASGVGLTAARASAEIFLRVKTARGEERVALADIRALIADSKYVSAYVAGREIILDQSLRMLEAEHADYFLRVHRNALVAAPHVLGLEKSTSQAGPDPTASHSAAQLRVRLADVEIMPLVSRRHAAAVRRLLRSH